MNFLEAKLVCKKHPYNNPQQGVCSSCVAEKLSNLSTPCNYHYPSLSNSTKTNSTQVRATNHNIHDHDRSNSSRSGGGDEDDFSPQVITCRGGHARHGSDSINHAGNVGDNSGLKKSRSMIAEFASSRKSRDVVVKKKGGFLAKLIRSTSKTTKDVNLIMTDHSRSTTTFVPTN